MSTLSAALSNRLIESIGAREPSLPRWGWLDATRLPGLAQPVTRSALNSKPIARSNASICSRFVPSGVLDLSCYKSIMTVRQGSVG